MKRRHCKTQEILWRARRDVPRIDPFAIPQPEARFDPGGGGTGNPVLENENIGQVMFEVLGPNNIAAFASVCQAEQHTKPGAIATYRAAQRKIDILIRLERLTGTAA